MQKNWQVLHLSCSNFEKSTEILGMTLGKEILGFQWLFSLFSFLCSRTWGSWYKPTAFPAVCLWFLSKHNDLCKNVWHPQEQASGDKMFYNNQKYRSPSTPTYCLYQYSPVINAFPLFLSTPKHRLGDIWSICTMLANKLCKIQLTHSVGTQMWYKSGASFLTDSRLCPSKIQSPWTLNLSLCSFMSLSLTCSSLSAGGQEPASATLPLLCPGTTMETRTGHKWDGDGGQVHLHWYYHMKCCCHEFGPPLV